MVNSTRSILSYLLSVLFFGIISVALHVELLLSESILFDYDLVTYFYPLWELRSEALRSLTLPLWNPYVFAGVPFLANIQTAVFYPLHWPLSFLDAPKAVAISYVLHLWLAGVFTFLFARVSLRLTLISSLFTGIVFMLSGFFSAQVGHINQVNAAAWLPLLLLFVDLSIRRRRPLYVALGGLVLALQLLAGHPQESYMTLVLAAAFTLFLAARETWGYVDAARSANANDALAARGIARRSGLVAAKYFHNLAAAFLCLSIIVLLGVAISGVQLLPTLELTRYSIRAGGFSLQEATSFSLPPWEVGRALLPAFKGYPFNEYVAYVGFVPLALVFVAALARGASGYFWFFLIMLLFGFVMALGRSTPVFEWMYYHLPGVSLFRVPARWLFMYTFAAAVLAGIGFNALWTMAPPQGQVLMRRLFSVACVVVVFMALWVMFYRLVGAVFTSPSSYGLLLWPLVAGMATLVVAFWWSFPKYRVFPVLVLLLTVGELAMARSDLAVYDLVPRQSYSSLRSGMLSLMAKDGGFRYLSLVDTAYVPGDRDDLQPVLQNYLPDDTAENYLILLKQREAVIPNTGMTLKLASIDGYDGGVLPLKSYFTVKQLLGGKDGVVLDDVPLLYSLKSIPDAKALGLLNVKYVLDDRLRDLWKDGIYYDLAFEQPVGVSSPLTLRSLSEFETTSVRVTARLVESGSVTQGEPVARVIVEDGYGQRVNHTIRAGMEIADSALSPDQPNTDTLHNIPPSGSIYNSDHRSYSYLALIDLDAPMYPKRISIEPITDKGQMMVDAVSLVDERTGADISVPIHPDWRPVYVGDLKVYENMKWLPRAYLAADYVLAESDEHALRLMAKGVNGKVVLDSLPSSWSSGDSRGSSNNTPRYFVDPEFVEIVEEVPGKLSIKVSTDEDTMLVLSESYYPGWVARLDGRETDVLPANRMFQAVYVPKGRHIVDFEYQSRFLGVGFLATLGGLAVSFSMAAAWPLLLLVVFVFVILPSKRLRRAKTTRGK